MHNKVILLTSLLFASNMVMAQQSLLDAASQGLQTGKAVEEGVKKTPADLAADVKNAATQKAEQAVKQQVIQAAPAEVKQGVETVNKVKTTVDAAPKSTGEAVKVAKTKAKQKVAENALNLLH